MDVICLGLSHRTAAVEVRERFAVPESEVPEVTRAASALEGIDEAVVVSTCNRVEIYAATADPVRAFPTLSDFLHGRSACEPGGEFYRFDAPQTIRHLFRLVCGLDSMVLGETEVFGQVKRAYLAACGAGGTARHLNKLFQRAFTVGKEVRSRTNITRGSVSVGSVAVDLAEKIFGRLGDCKVMVIGAGETSEQTARTLLGRGARSIFVANRSFDRAAALAEEMGGRAIRFGEWDAELKEVDILIASTAAPHWVLTREKLEPVMRRRLDRPLFAIDLAVPRDIEPEVNKVEGVFLYDIDSLEAIAEESLAIRQQEVAACETIVERHVGEFAEWLANAKPLPRAPRAPMVPRCQAVES